MRRVQLARHPNHLYFDINDLWMPTGCAQHRRCALHHRWHGCLRHDRYCHGNDSGVAKCAQHGELGKTVTLRSIVTSERGTTLVETAIALAILLVVMAGLLSMAAFATSLTENQGHLAARTTEYAQDKM